MTLEIFPSVAYLFSLAYLTFDRFIPWSVSYCFEQLIEVELFFFLFLNNKKVILKASRNQSDLVYATFSIS